jgi:hypothetical protein
MRLTQQLPRSTARNMAAERSPSMKPVPAKNARVPAAVAVDTVAAVAAAGAAADTVVVAAAGAAADTAVVAAAVAAATAAEGIGTNVPSVPKTNP